MATEKPPIEHYRADPERYKELPNGTFIENSTGKICATFPALNPHAITKETARGMQQRQRELGMLAQLRALAKKSGIDVDGATLEEIVKGAATAIEALHGHAYDLAMAATTARGIEGIYPKIYEPFTGDPRTPAAATPPPETISLSVQNLFAVSAEIERLQAAALERSRAVDAESWAVSQEPA